MSQMKPYCFKCGAELDPDAIYCPECGRLQRSMVVRTGGQDTPEQPPAPYPSPTHDQPYQFYPDREAPAAEQPGPAEQYPDQHDPYAQQYPEHDWSGGQQADPHGEHAPYTEPGGDQVYARQDYDQQQPWSDTGYGQHDAAGYDGQPAPGQEPAYDQYEQSQAAYGQHDPAYPQQEADSGQDWPYDHDPNYGRQDSAYGQRTPEYGQHDPTAYDQRSAQPYPEPEAPPAEPAPPDQPWPPSSEPYRTPDQYTPPAPIYHQPAPPVPPGPEAGPRPGEPVYSSSAPIPAGGLEPYTPPPPPTGGYGPPTTRTSRYGQPPASNPYALATYEPDTSYGQPSRRTPLRIIALGAAALLVLFLLAFVGGQLLGSRSPSPSAAAPPTTQPTTATSAQPSATPTATAAATATPGQGITGNARFVRVSSEITGRCSGTAGCPVSGTFRNTGQQGSGSVTFNVTDQGGGTVYATCTTPIPQTDAGQTATASCSATGDALGQLFHTNPGATVYLQTQINGQ